MPEMTYRHITMMVWSVASDGESNRLNITKEVAQYRIDAANSLLNALIEAGLEEDEAYAAVAANMAGNMDEFNRIVGTVADDISVNMDGAATNMADSISINAICAQTSFDYIIDKAHEAADAVKAAGKGERKGSTGKTGSGGFKNRKGKQAVTHSGDFDTTTVDFDEKTIDLDDFESQLELDIKGYTDAIANIDTQIEILKNLQSTFDTNGGIGGHGYADQIKQLEKEKGDINNALKDSTGSAASAKEEKETAETFNWIETALSRIQRVVKNLGDTVSATWKNWTERNTALVSEFSEIRKEITLQQSAYESYMRTAESVGLSDYYKDLVRNGALSIESITDDTLKEQIKAYQEWYEKALDCSDAVSELNDSLADLAKTKFDNITAQYDAKLQDIDHMVNMVNGELEKAETLNQIAGESFYNALIQQENARLENLAKEYTEKLAALNESVSTGVIESGSEAWQEMKADIDSVTEAIQESDNQILEYEKNLKEIAKLKFDSLESQFDNAIGLITSEISQVEKQTALIEEAGYMAGEAFYKSLIGAEKENVKALVTEYKSLSSALKQAMADGSVRQFDDNWYAMTESIHDVEDALLDAETALVSYSNSLRELEWDVFDRMQGSINGLTEESDFIMELMKANKELYDDTGSLNDRGLAVQGLHTVNYDIYMRQVQEYADAIKDISKELADDPNNIKLQDRYKELAKLQREAVLNAENEKTAIKELASDGYDKLLSSIDSLVSARKDALSEEKNLHDYEKNVSEQSSEVAKYQKLLEAYRGNDSEGTKTAIQKAQENLAKAQEALSETEYDRYISEQESMLDTFRDDVEEWVNSRLDDINGLLQSAIDATNAGAGTIREQISGDLSAVGMAMTENFQKLFNIDYSGGMSGIVSGFCGNGGTFSSTVSEVNTSVNRVIDGITEETGMIKTSADSIISIISERFPGFTDSIPGLDRTNDSIGAVADRVTDVKEAVGLVRDAIDAVRVTVAELNMGDTGNVTVNTGGSDSGTDTSKKSADWSISGIREFNTSEILRTGMADIGEPPIAKKAVLGDAPEARLTAANEAPEPKKATASITAKTSAGTDPEREKDTNVKVYVNAYKNGEKKVDKDQAAITQEDGPEVIISPTHGVLTPLRRGDTIFTAEQTESLHKLSQIDQKRAENLQKLSLADPSKLMLYPDGKGMPDILKACTMREDKAPVNNNMSSNNNIEINISLPEVKDGEGFIRFMQTPKGMRMLNEAVSGQMLGKNKYNIMKYK